MPRLTPCPACRLRFPDREAQLQSLGELLAYAFLQGDTVQLPLAAYILDQVYGEMEPNLERLEEYDGELATHMRWLQDNEVEELDMDCSVTVTSTTGQHCELPMVAAARVASSDASDALTTPLTNDNKDEFVQQVATFRLVRQHEKEVEALREGFRRVDPLKAMKIFSGAELRLLINGQTELNVQEWQQHTNYNGYSSNSQVDLHATSPIEPTPQLLLGMQPVRWFWQAVDQLTQSERAMLLQFITGSSR